MAQAKTAARESLFILTVLKLIPRSGWITTDQLLQTLEEQGHRVEMRTLQRILKSLLDCEDLNVECNKKSKPYGYRRSIPDSDLGVTKLRPQEALLLRLAEEHLKYQLPSPIMKTLKPLFESARLVLNESGSTQGHSTWLQKVAFVPDSIALMPPKILPRIFDAVSEALYRGCKLDVEYRNADGAAKKHTVSPLGLIQQEHRLYLICKFDNHDNIRHLALHRIKNAVGLEFPAERPKNFKLKDYLENRHANYSNGRKVRFIVEFTNLTTHAILEETPFNRTQTMTALGDGAWRLEAVMDDTVLLDGWVAAWKEIAGIRSVQKIPFADDDNP